MQILHFNPLPLWATVNSPRRKPIAWKGYGSNKLLLIIISYMHPNTKLLDLNFIK